MNILKEIKELIHKYPNDQKLGNVVRYKYRDKELYEDQGDGHLIEIDSHLIYESPDNGNTVYSREFGKEERVLMEGFISGHKKWEEVPRIPEEGNPNQLNLFND